MKPTVRIGKYLDFIRKEGFLEFLITIKKNALFLFQRTFFSREGMLLKKIHGSWMYLNVYEEGISTALAIDGKREVLETEIVKKVLKKGMRVLDIGANIGYYTLIEASIVTDQGKVYALEPAPRNVDMLRKNVSKNKYLNIVEIYPVAVSNKTGVSKLHLSNMANLHTMIFLGSTKPHGKTGHMTGSSLDVKTVKVDDFLKGKKPVNLIRMDIEGYECEAIDGMINTLKTSPSLKIMMEVHPNTYGPDRNFKTRLQKLDKLGYTAKYVVSAGVPQPARFKEMGYTPDKIAKDSTFHRGLYTDITMRDLIELTCSLPKCVRAVLLEKK
ncbi:MAG: FkbM family methyltransferase [archaeon]